MYIQPWNIKCTKRKTTKFSFLSVLQSSSWSEPSLSLSKSDIDKEAKSVISLSFVVFLFVYLCLVDPSIRTLSEYHNSIATSGLNSVIGLPSSLIRKHADRRLQLYWLLKSNFTRAIREKPLSTFALVNGVQSKISIKWRTFLHSSLTSEFMNILLQMSR